MRKTYTPEEWATLGQIVNATIELQNLLEEKGFDVINSFEKKTNDDSICFIVTGRGILSAKTLSCCIFNVLDNQERIAKELFAKGEELLALDPVEAEKEALKKRLAELENNG